MILLKNGKPRFKRYTSTGALYDTIDLDYTLLPGKLWVNWRKIFLSHDIIDFSADEGDFPYGMPYEAKVLIGWDIFFTFSYAQYHKEDMTYKMGQLFDSEADGFTVKCFPRLDDTTFGPEVTDLNDDIQLSLRNKRSAPIAYEGLVLNFKTKYPVKKLNWLTSAQVAATYGGEYKLPATGQIET